MEKSPQSLGNQTYTVDATWMDQPSVPQLNNSCDGDAELLHKIMNVNSLNEDHPVRLWWDNRIVGSRFHLHHLADDIRQVIDVPGAKNLFRQLRNNLSGFADFRFELHMAGALGRASGQKLISLGGDKSGPDIEVQIKSGHRCGFACYRAASEIYAISKLRRDLSEIVQSLKTTVLSCSTVSQTIVIDFADFPLQTLHAQTARTALRQFLTETDKGEMKAECCHLFRLEPPVINRRTQSRVVRLRLQIPVPNWEKQRVFKTLSEKVERESIAWASNYKGLPMLAIEESMFGQDMRPVLKQMMSAENKFVGSLATYLIIRPDNLGIPHGLEDVAYFFRSGTSDVNIGIETFGDNVESWAAGYAFAAHVPASIREEWDIVTGYEVNRVSLIRSASLDRVYARVPYTNPEKPTKDEATVKRLKDAVIQLLEWQKTVR